MRKIRMRKSFFYLMMIAALVLCDNIAMAQDAILPFGQYSQQPWEAKYYQTSTNSDETPGENWYAIDFDESEWEIINGPISNTGRMYHSTRWDPEDAAYWVRRHFTVETIDMNKVYTLHAVHDDGCVMYLNGHLIYEKGGVREDTKYAQVFDLEKLSYLQEGDNVLAVKVGNTGRGDAYMDFGIYVGDPVKELTLSQDRISIRKGSYLTLEAAVNEDAYDKSIEWHTADGNVASVSADGKVYGQNIGQTTITVTSILNPEVSATCIVNVYEPDSAHWILPWGKDEAWTMKYRHYELAEFEEPAVDTNGKNWTEAGYDDATWEALSGPMASENVSFGTGNYLWEGEQNCFCLRRTFTIQELENRIYYFMTQHDDDIKVYVNGQQIADRTYYNAEEVGLYLIPNESLVVGENTLAIYIQQLGGNAYLDYAIEMEVKATNVKLSEEELTLMINEDAQLTAVVDGTTSTIQWSVADNSIASVTKEGKVRGKKTGTTTITATSVSDFTISATCTVTVTTEYAPLTTGWLQLMGEEDPWTMRYQFYELADSTSPATDSKGLHWYEVGYDDTEWKTIVGPLGGITPWDGDNNCFYLRGNFVIPEVPEGTMRFYSKHDDGTILYVNGVKVREHGYDMGLHNFEIPDTLLHIGENTIAVYAQEDGGGAYFDYGLYYTEAEKFSIIATSKGNGSVSGSGIYKVGTEVVLTAVADEGNRFVEWSDGSKDNPRIFVATGNKELTAIFEEIPYAANMVLPFGQFTKMPWKACYYRSHIEENVAPSENWYAQDFDDSEWSEIDGPISNDGGYYYATRWESEGSIYWVRRTFTLDSIATDMAYVLHTVHDDGCLLYLNGHLIYENGNVQGDDSRRYYLDVEKAAYLREGENVIAVRVSDTGRGVAFMDFGLYLTEKMPVTRIELSASDLTLKTNEFTQLTAITNEDATNRSVIWSVADSTVATVTAEGLVQGISAGTTTITVTSVANLEVMASCTVTVTAEVAPITILPWGKEQAWTMNYLYYELADYTEPETDENGKGWTELGYDDTAWGTLTGPMASSGIWYSNWNYLWEGEYNCFCLRRTFTLSEVYNGRYMFKMQHDDDIMVYLNGKLVIDEPDWTDERISTYNIPSNAFVTGENMLAIYIRQNHGGAYLDYGLFYQEAVEYTVATNSDGNGTVTGGGKYAMGTEATLTAVPAQGYRFVGWSDGSTENPLTFTVNGDVELTAIFEEIPVAPDTIVAIPEGYYNVFYTDSMGVRQYLHMAGENNWAVHNKFEVIKFSNGNVTDQNAFAPAASFMEYNGYYMSNVQNSDGTGPINTVGVDGQLGSQKRTWESQVFYRNETGKYAIRLTNTTGTDWGCHLFVNVDPQTLKVVAADPSLGEALYIWELEQTDSVPNYGIKNVSVKASQGGTVTGGGEYVVGTEVTLTAVPDEGYHFAAWSNGSSENPYTFEVNTDVELTAEFAPNTYGITYWVDGVHYEFCYVEYGAVIPPVKEPTKEGYTFIGWTDLPETMPAMDLSVYSTFVLNAEQTDSQGLNYSLNDSKDAFEFSGCTDSVQTEVVIPSEVHGIPVTTIGDGAFMGATDLKTVVIPSGVTTVGDKAFYGCDNLLWIEWNSSAPVKGECFSDVAHHGNLLVFAPAGATVTYEGNVIVGGVAEHIKFTDGLPLSNPRDFIAKYVEYSRVFTKKTYLGTTSGWEALVLPFDVQRLVSESRGELKPFADADFVTSLPYWLAEAQHNGTFASVDKITAGVPFIMEVPNSDDYDDEYNVEGTITFSSQNITVCATANATSEMGGGYTFVGSYEGTAAARDVYAINDDVYTTDGEAYMPGGVFVADSRDIRPFEAYIYSNNASAAPYLRIGGKGSTGINELTMDNGQLTIYDLTGRRVLKSEALKSGIYIVNGRKVVIK